MEGGGGPQQGGHPPLLHVLKQRQGEQKQLLGQDLGGSPPFQRLVQVLHRQIKVERRLIAKHIPLAQPAELPHPLGKVDEAAVGYDNALGGTRRAGGKNGIGGVHVQHPAAPPGQQLLLRLGGPPLCQGHAGPGGKLRRQGLVLPGVQHQLRLQPGENGLQPRLGHPVIQGHIVIAAGQHAHQGGHCLHRPIRQHRHRPVHRPGAGRNGAAQPLGGIPQLAEGKAGVLIGKGDLLRHPAGRLPQVIQPVSHPHRKPHLRARQAALCRPAPCVL